MHILYATDGSEGARLAGDTLARMPLPPDPHVTVLHVVTRYTPTAAALPHGVMDSLREDEDARAIRIVNAGKKALAEAGWQVTTRTLDGPPAQRICETAAEGGHDLIVTGALGLSGWLRVLLGSTSTTVVKHAPCPVWVVKRPFKSTGTDVLVATDGSDHAREAIRAVCAMPLPPGAVAHLMYVVPALNEQLHLTGSVLDPPILEPVYEVGRHLRQRGEQVLKEDAATLGGRFAEVRTFIEEGDARRRILSAAAEVEADLIVLGSKGLSGVREFLLGSVSHKVLKHAKASVLIAPLPGR
jgi:nucleotide-binding universal stress UspA family protein